MGRPKVRPEALRKKRYVLLSDQELAKLGLTTAFSPWAREKLLAAASPAPAPTDSPEPKPPEKELLTLPPWGQPDAQGATYTWEWLDAKHTAGTLSILSSTKRIEVDLVEVSLTSLRDRIELRFTDRSEFRVTAKGDDA